MAQKRADPKKPGSGRPVEGRKSEPASESSEGFSEVKIRGLRRTTIADVKVSNGPRVVHYKAEGYYVLVLKPSYVLEVEIDRGERIQKRYYVVGRVFSLEPIKEIDDALKTFENIATNTDHVLADELQLVMVPRRIMKKVVEVTRKNPTKSYLVLLQAQGVGRQRTYTIVKIVEAGFTVDNPDDETLGELEEALKNVLNKIGSKKNGGKAE